MRKILLTAACAIAVSTSFGQRIGIHAAGILSSQSISASGISISSDSRVSWKAGLVGELKIGPSIRFMPQLNVVSKGAKFDLDFGGTGNVTSTSHLTYIEVPLLFTYNTPVGLFIGAGPSFSFGIGGKETATQGGQTESTKVKFDGNENATDNYSHYKGTDIGGQVLVGFHLPKGFFVNAHYSFGFSSIAPGDPDEGKLKNRYFGLGLGKFFGK